MRTITGFPVCSRIKKYSLWNKQKTWLGITFVKTHLSSRLYKWYIFIEEILLPISYFSLVPQFGKSLLIWFSFLGFFFEDFFLCVPFLKSLLNLLQYCFCFKFQLLWPQDMWELSFPTRDWTHTLYIGRQSLNHWTTREVLKVTYFKISISPLSSILSFH